MLTKENVTEKKVTEICFNFVQDSTYKVSFSCWVQHATEVIEVNELNFNILLLAWKNVEKGAVK